MQRSEQRHRRRNSDIGHLAELRTREWLGDRVGLVPDSFGDVPAQDALDAVFIRPVVGDAAGTIFEVGTPVDAKAVAYRVKDQSSTRRGRVQIRRYSHEWLLDHDGEYAIHVYDRDALVFDDGDVAGIDEGGWLAQRLISARTVDAVISSWCKDGMDDVARVPWATLMDESRVNGGETA